jgi:hypothetical protein
MVRPPKGDGCVVLAFSPRKATFHKSLKRLEGIGYQRKG